MEMIHYKDIDSGKKEVLAFGGQSEHGYDQVKELVSSQSPNMICCTKNHLAEKGILLVSRDVVYHQRAGKYLSDCTLIMDKVLGITTILAKMRGEWYYIGQIQGLILRGKIFPLEVR